MSSRKAAIELSMNFFVILIISLVVFGSGMALFWKIYQHGEEELGRVSRNVEQMIIRQLHGGDKVSVVPRSIDLDRGDQYIIGIGIKNVLIDETVFNVFVKRGLFVREEFTCIFDEFDLCIDEDDVDKNILPLKILGGDAELRVEANKQEISNIMIKADRKAMSGEYVINICVCHDQNCIDYATCVAGLAYDKNYPVSKIRVKVI